MFFFFFFGGSGEKLWQNQSKSTAHEADRPMTDDDAGMMLPSHHAGCQKRTAAQQAQ